MNGSEKQFSFTRAASSTSWAAKSKFLLSVIILSVTRRLSPSAALWLITLAIHAQPSTARAQAATAGPSHNAIAPRTAAIPFDQIGALAGKQYSGDGLVGPVSVLTFDTSNAHRSGSSPTWRSSIQQVGGGLGKLFAETRLKPGIFNARTKERVG